MIKKEKYSQFIIFIFLILISPGIQSQSTNDRISEKVKDYVADVMKEGKIPGLSYVIINNNRTGIGNFGYSNIKTKEKVTSQTLFELGSTSKAFTALALLNIEKEGKISLDDHVTDYLPWFYVKKNDSLASITLRQLIHHTSGIPWYTISLIPQSNKADALEQTIKNINGIELHKFPGEQYEYATINYDILALVVEKVAGKPFETYIKDNIFKDLELNNTTIGKTENSLLLSKGYKIGFFKPREYNAPVYKGNNAAGYIISNAEDIAKWMRYQMGLIPCQYDSLILKSHMRDKSVLPHNLSSYAYGWEVSLKGDGEIYHGGLNPNFTSHITFRKKEGIGVAVLANSNSAYTYLMAQNIMKILVGEEVSNNFNPDDTSDKAFSIVSVILSIYLLAVIAFLVYVLRGIFKGDRKYELFTFKKLGSVSFMLIFLMPFLYGIYLLPKAMAGFSWEAALVWTPVSFPVLVILCLVSVGLSLLAYIFTIIFPEKNEYVRNTPQIILLSILSGLSNMVVILLITSSMDNKIEMKYLLYYFGLSMIVYLLGRKIVQTKMIHFTRNIIYDLRMKLINKVFSTSYEKFEKIDRGRIYTTMNDDIGTIGESANIFVNVTTSIITAGGAFLYMATLDFWATLITLILIGSISTIYYIVSRRTQILFEDARETRTVYMRLLNGMIDGFKELSISRVKKNEYKNEVEYTTDEYRKKMSFAHVKFVNAFLVGESLLIIVLAIVAFAIPILFPGIQFYTVMSFVIILLYLIGPVNAILGAIPALMQFKIAWNRVKSFIQDIPANLDLNKLFKMTLLDKNSINSLKTKSLSYKYNDENNQEIGFSVGPIDLEVNKGEVLFIIGGNGSGKTTLAKLITGLYTLQKGSILINNKEAKPSEIGEYFSTVFNPNYIFQKIYDVDIEGRQVELEQYLSLLQLEKKVKISDNEYNTIELSGGQRKRLALLQCYLEDKPIYLFDEWAADQDPEYKRFFYRELIPIMKKDGKIVIAISHDDHYFDVADKILKMDNGKVEYVSNDYKVDKILSV